MPRPGEDRLRILREAKRQQRHRAPRASAARTTSACPPKSKTITGSPVASASCVVKENVSGQSEGISQQVMP